ncbi:MAG: ribonuclease P protein component [Bacteroidaceae bacterium]|nr:ribonuclease P protein component [Bacteroidaceae bacterium]
MFSFDKSQRLCSRKAIEALFASGNRAISAFPLRVIYRPAHTQQVLCSVSKRHFRHAVDRNRAKRQMREAWRLHHGILEDAALHIAFIWLSDTPQPSELVHRKMKNLLHRITEDIEVNSQFIIHNS